MIGPIMIGIQIWLTNCNLPNDLHLKNYQPFKQDRTWLSIIYLKINQHEQLCKEEIGEKIWRPYCKIASLSTKNASWKIKIRHA